MEKRTAGIKILGWFFILISLFLFITSLRGLYLFHKLYVLSKGLPKDANLVVYSEITNLIITLLGCPFFLATGIGILRIKKWAYYLSLSAPFIYFTGMARAVWLFGPQYYSRMSTICGMLIWICIWFFLLNKSVIERFSANSILRNGKRLNPKKNILVGLIVVMLANAVPVCSLLWLVRIRHRDYSSIFNIKPRKVKYSITGKEFILNNCKKINMFDYSLYIPKGWRIGMINDKGPGWSVGFISGGSSNLSAIIMLESKSKGQLLFPAGKIPGLNTAFDFERMIYRPAFGSLFITLKALELQHGLIGIDELDAATWRGFVKIFKSQEKYIYDGSIYSLRGNKTCGIVITITEGIMNSAQAKSIIASIEFLETDKNSKVLFEEGKAFLSNGDFISAGFNFLNAFYIEKNNPEYAYYFALSLFRDSSNAFGKNRFILSKEFLGRALKLNPGYQEAKELLTAVDKEIEQTNISAKKE